VNNAKRQHLLIEALRFTKSDLRLIIAGPPDRQEDATALEALVDELDLRSRVTLDLRFVERMKIANYMNNALAVAYLPFQEDSVGYVTAEAFLAHKPVLTTTDSGGVLEIVTDGETGLVRPPDPRDLAEAMDYFAKDRAACVRMGQTAHDVWQTRGISWDQSISALMN
jgi:glycosyltransferase involved in cell wall biosynthesis